ncbi:peptide alpha-N-acetyltransferase subunit NAT5 [Ascoidea rubescens DSM 1968]|uniref:Acyl-CoA N-acyltransferase n=1 Tax=Ascoidea rubescens DSM 1968 TaxID=1344418 RepID=A0A1D2VIT9_9ASCO|nr:acyl-CoA N-acyltransferase [Ascoidea rubescens DSM 1968]ODV61443.1 acyl-CoA N-acyltransferase [Ascoidea rubescens DSM 1968]
MDYSRWISLDEFTVNNLGVVKKINEVSMPIAFKESFYSASVEQNNDLNQIAYFKEIPVGVIKCRLIMPTKSDGSAATKNKSSSKILPKGIYIDSLCVLEKYRRLGIASKLLEYIRDKCSEYFLHEIVCHVWVDNKEAMQFYEKNGFKVKNALVKDYYKSYTNDLNNQTDAIYLSLTI